MVALAARVLAHGSRRWAPALRRREIRSSCFARRRRRHDGARPLDLEAEAKALRSMPRAGARPQDGALIAASCVIGGLSTADDVSRGYIEALRS